MSLKIFVDDIRSGPTNEPGWVICRTICEAIRIISNHRLTIETISLDHDISHQVSMNGDHRPYPCGEDFSAVAHFIGEIYRGCENPPKIILHTSNPCGAVRMQGILKDAGLNSEIKPSRIPANRLEMTGD